MNLKELVPGMYEIAVDVKNPKADRRRATRDFASWVVWPKGKRVRVVADLDHADLFTIFLPNGHEHLGVRGRQGGRMNHPGLEALVAALQPVEMTDLERIRFHLPAHDRILAHFLKTKKLTWADLEEARENFDREG